MQGGSQQEPGLDSVDIRGTSLLWLQTRARAPTLRSGPVDPKTGTEGRSRSVQPPPKSARPWAGLCTSSWQPCRPQLPPAGIPKCATTPAAAAFFKLPVPSTQPSYPQIIKYNPHLQEICKNCLSLETKIYETESSGKLCASVSDKCSGPAVLK